MFEDFKGIDTRLGRALGAVYGGLRHLDQLRKSMKTKTRPSVPTISIGNVTVGGTGKTPMTLYLAETLKARGLKPAVLTRGYMGRETGPLRVEVSSGSGRFDVDRFGDEAVILANYGLEVFVAKKRESGVALAQDGADILLLEDGFQRVEIARDLDLVMFNADGVGNGKLLPAGTLRDSLTSLERGDAFCGPGPGLPVFLPNTPRFEFDYGPMKFSGPVDLDKPVAALAAIAHPRAFFNALEKQGCQIEKRFAFSDHHTLDRESLQDVVQICEQRSISNLIVTAKDAIKLGQTLDGLTIITARAPYQPVNEDVEKEFWRYLKGRLGV